MNNIRVNILKLALALLSVLLFLRKEHYEYVEVIDGYTLKPSYHCGDTLKACINFKRSSYKTFLRFYNCYGVAVDSVSCVPYPQVSDFDSLMAQGYKVNVVCKLRLEAGLYTIEKRIPLVVYDTVPSDLTIVYPFGSLNMENNLGGKSMFIYNSEGRIPNTRLSLNRNQVIDSVAFNFMKYCRENFRSLKLNAVSDIQLQKNSPVKTKCLVFLNSSGAWTKGMDSFVARVLAEKTNIIIASGNARLFKLEYDESQGILKSSNPMELTNWFSKNKAKRNINPIGSDFHWAGYGLNKDKGWNGFKLNKDFLDLKRGVIIPLPSVLNSGVPVTENSGRLKPNIGWAWAEVIGYDYNYYLDVNSMAVWWEGKRKNEEGLVLNLASAAWLYPANLKRQDVQKIVNHYLQKYTGSLSR